MASQQHDAVFREEDMDDDDDESQEDEEYEEDDDVLADDEENEPSPSAALAVTVAVPGSAVSNGGAAPISTPTATTIVVSDSSDQKRRRVEQIEEKKPPVDDSRRLFQRLWTDEDEIELLQGFLDYTSQRGSSHHNDTALFYDQIKSKLQLDFNKNQLVEKIRRLKKKYRNVLNKIGSGKEFSFKSAHDQATFEISRKIWSNVAPIGDNSLDDDEINPSPNPNPNSNLNPNLNFSPVILKNETIFRNSAEKKTPKRPRPRSAVKIESNDGSAANRDHNCISNATATTVTATATTNATTVTTNNNNCNSGGYSNNIPSVVEETVRSCLSPVLKELVAGAMGGPFGARGFSLNLNPMPFMNLSFGGGEMVDEKWRKQQILELEVYSKRLELVQDQIKAAMEELRSNGGGG
ncbi:Mediator-associated protein 1 [Spatholobus suberectus]|nr:Mediator-associated protein 1 [Spatholobus suberectus]